MNRVSKILIGLFIISTIFAFAKPSVKITNEWAAEELDEINQNNQYDVIVVGTDPEGIAAAVSTARSGAKTLLISKDNTLGGLFTLGMLNSIDMNRNDSGELLTRGIFNEFYVKIGSKDSFDIDVAKKVFEEMVNSEEKLTYLPNYKFVDPIMDNKTVIGVKMENNNKEEVFYGKRIIDATQDGDVVAKAQDIIAGGFAEGKLYFTGMGDLNLSEKMAATLVFKVDGVNWGELEKDIKAYRRSTGDSNCGINETSAWGFGKWCYDKYIPAHNNMKLRGPNMGLQNDGTILINALQIFDIDGLNEESIQKAKELGAEEIVHVLEYLKTVIPSFKNATLAGVADELYIRETRHIRGEYVLTAADILDNANFYDKIALGSYPIDIQSTSIGNTGFVIGKPMTYSIPLRCLIPLEAENIFIVGKAASYSSVAAGSARVVPVGMVEGESAGIIAVYSIIEDITPRNLANSEEKMKEVNILLKNQGVYLPEFDYDSTIPDIKGADAIRKIVNLGCLSAGYNNDYKLEDNATNVSFMLSLVNGIERFDATKDSKKIIGNLAKYYSTDDLTALKAGEIIASFFGQNVEDLPEDSKWEFVNKQRYFVDIDEKLNKNEIINRRQMYILTVSTLEKYLGRELK